MQELGYHLQHLADPEFKIDQLQSISNSSNTITVTLNDVHWVPSETLTYVYLKDALINENIEDNSDIEVSCNFESDLPYLQKGFIHLIKIEQC